MFFEQHPPLFNALVGYPSIKIIGKGGSEFWLLAIQLNNAVIEFSLGEAVRQGSLRNTRGFCLFIKARDTLGKFSVSHRRRGLCIRQRRYKKEKCYGRC